MRDSINRKYDQDWLQYDRPQPMYNSHINKFYDSFYKENPIHTENLDEMFKNKFVEWLNSHQYSKFTGIESFSRRDIINGCTQYIDDLYQRCGELQTFENDYKYHWRLNPEIKYTTIDTLDPTKELLMSMPFPYYGDIHPDMSTILDRCYNLNIPVHIDGAWISCIKDINFNFDHPAIKSFGISLSKGGLGGNRIGVRFSRTTPPGPVSIMNDFNMNSQALVSMGIKFIETFGPEYFWKVYSKSYDQVIKDFNLLPTKAVHLARNSEGKPVGIRSLLRCLIK
jgi:hypothetical protein